jgi:hypothetical protein
MLRPRWPRIIELEENAGKILGINGLEVTYSKIMTCPRVIAIVSVPPG